MLPGSSHLLCRSPSPSDDDITLLDHLNNITKISEEIPSASSLLTPPRSRSTSISYALDQYNLFGPSYFDYLPQELKIRIFRCLPLDCILKISRVSAFFPLIFHY